MKALRLVVGVLVIAIVLFVAWWRYAPDRFLWSTEIGHGNELVRQIETFHHARSRLPDSLGEVGNYEENRGRLFYEKCDGNHYIVWFGTTLGHSMTYDSADGSWHSLNVLCSSVGAGEVGRSHVNRVHHPWAKMRAGANV